jgi:hypothetical protein
VLKFYVYSIYQNSLSSVYIECGDAFEHLQEEN